MVKKLEIVINPLENFHNCNGCLKYGVVEASTPQTIALTVASISDKGVKSPPLYYCFNCADSDFITNIRREITADMTEIRCSICGLIKIEGSQNIFITPTKTDNLGYKTEEPTYCLACAYENRIKQQVEASTFEQRRAKHRKEEQESWRKFFHDRNIKG
ncbi:206_t:CDS:2 [Racocetra persica]|uniref:206_t:CDS:1 n=1 Tax=Racocetra persica TaxID=160502 RepID=A0ACA9Q873_9GLOM|nr:206_t:CDS:2 [Racocetra persica]